MSLNILLQFDMKSLQISNYMYNIYNISFITLKWHYAQISLQNLACSGYIFQKIATLSMTEERRKGFRRMFCFAKNYWFNV